MARFGKSPEFSGQLRVESLPEGWVRGYFEPLEPPEKGTPAARRLEDGVLLLEARPSEHRVLMFPIEARPWEDDFLGPKYGRLRTLSLDWLLDDEPDLVDLLEELPSGFTKDYEYGLGFARACQPFVDFVLEQTDCSRISIDHRGGFGVKGADFRMSYAVFDEVRREMNSIKSRGDYGVRRVRHHQIYERFREELRLPPRELSLGRLETSKWMTRVAADAWPLNPVEQVALLLAAKDGARSIAEAAPAKVVALQRDIEMVNLDRLIERFDRALGQGHQESWWQNFFEENRFVLQLLFGGPAVFVDAQVSIGDGSNTAKGKKIADYMLRNGLTNNAAIVEIKRPSTGLLRRVPYRAGVYGVKAEIAGAIVQVLDQAHRLIEHGESTRSRTSDAAWVATAPRCFVVAGSTQELGSDDRRRSFELYREQLGGVRLVTFDEILEQLNTLRDFIRQDSQG